MINIKENRRGNHEWTIQRHWQHWVHKTQDKDKQNKKTQHRKLKWWATRIPPKTSGEPMIMDVLAKAKQFMPLIRHSPLIITWRFIYQSHTRYRSSGAHFEMWIISTVELVQSDTCVFPTSCDIRQKCMVPNYFC